MNYHSIKKGAAGGMLALMLLAAAPAPQARAATLEELQAQVQALIAQLAALKGDTSTTGSCGLFTTDLTLGQSGVQVTELQRFLISRGHVIPAGATGYFGAQTQTAVAAFQRAQGIVPAAGYFGPVTRARVNALCTPVTPVPDPGNTNGNTPSQPTLRGEGSFKNYEAKNGDDTNLEEGQKNVSIMDVEFDVDGGDVRINRIDVAFTPGNNNNEKDPWDTFSEVTLYNGKDRIGKIDAGNKKNWDEDAPNDGDYQLRFSGINWTVEEDETAELSVRITTQNNIRGAEDGETWDVFIPNNGIRGLDADKVSVHTGDSADTVTIDIDEAGNQDEIIVKRSDEDPDATTLRLDDSKRSSWMTVFAFDLDTDDSTNDIEIRKLPIQFTVNTGTVGTLMQDVRLSVDGQIFTKKAITDGATNIMVFEFKRDEFMIDAGDRITVEVEAQFKSLSLANEGTTIVGSVDVSGIEAEGADDLEGNQLSGSATGEVHTLRTFGAIITPSGATADLRQNGNSTRSDDSGGFSIMFDVTAFDRDLYIPRTAERGTTLGTAGVNFIIEDASTGEVITTAGTSSPLLDSDAREENGYFLVRRGETREFTLMVDYDPETTSFFRVQLHSFNWSPTESAPTVQQFVHPERNYQSPSVFVGD